MKFIAATALLAGALAAPAEMDVRTNVDVCPQFLFSVPQCVSANVANLACLDATNPSRVPRDGPDFKNICAAIGKQASCATLPLLGLGLLCIPAVGAQ